MSLKLESTFEMYCLMISFIPERNTIMKKELLIGESLDRALPDVDVKLTCEGVFSCDLNGFTYKGANDRLITGDAKVLH
jgi:hypothetical protein